MNTKETKQTSSENLMYISTISDWSNRFLQGTVHCVDDKTIFVTMTSPYKGITNFQRFRTYSNYDCGCNENTEGRATWMLKKIYETILTVEKELDKFKALLGEYDELSKIINNRINTLPFENEDERRDYIQATYWDLKEFHEELVRKYFPEDVDWYLPIHPDTVRQILNAISK